jgi:putative tryptophan/tyrosine transport system substrate-binding protein
MRRREIIGLVAMAVAFLPWAGTAQTTKVYRVGLLTGGAPISTTSADGSALIRNLAQRGYALGRNISFDSRGAMGQQDQLPQVARDLVADKVDVIVTWGYPATLAGSESGVPTVAASGLGDPVATGLIHSLAQPGGNVTGLSDNATDLSVKRLELLKEAVPGLRRVAMLWNKGDPAMTLRYNASASVADTLGMSVQPLGVGEPDDFAEAFAVMEREMPDAILMVADTLTLLNRQRVYDFARQHRLAAIYEMDALVRDGGLMSYGADRTEIFDRTAALVDRILKGDKPDHLPFELPTRFKFAVNLKTAKAIGLELSPSLVARADEVIE